jgi:hypothetical protein
LALPLVGGLLAFSAGCTSLLFTATYLIKGNNIPAEFKALKGKRVAVVCRSPVAQQYSNATVPGEVAKQLGMLLRDNVPKIKVISDREVAEWTDENAWEDYTEIGKALDAEFVVAVELEHFSLYLHPTLYQGNASARVQIFDMSKEDEIAAFEKSIPRLLYPPNIGIPTQEMPESQFRSEFIKVLADRIGQSFYASDKYSNFAEDSRSLK